MPPAANGDDMTDQLEGPGASDRLAAISALGEPTRRALYEYIVTTGDWVSRDQAADAIGLERGTAAHHLDRLAGDGLLEIEYRRLSGRQGPGAGRPAKLYRRADQEFGVNLPPRDYQLAGRLLAEAADQSRLDGTDITTALGVAARRAGRLFAEEIRERVRRLAGRRRSERRQVVLETLEHHGFEPHVVDDATIVLRNCPFHQLAREHTELICGMNLCLLGATLEDLGDTGLAARLEPENGQCCVKLEITG
jgi:predicted ArsR family transcriptional regulator